MSEARKPARPTKRVELSLEDTQKNRLRIEGKKVPSFEPYASADAAKTGPKKDLRKLGEWIKAKRRADEVKQGEESLARPGKKPQG